MSYTEIGLDQNCEEWLRYRKNYIGASDAAAIMGVSPWSNPYKLWEEKLGLKENFTSACMQRGKNLEGPARRYFHEKTAIMIRPAVIKSNVYEWMIASLDGISYDGKYIVEIKCPGQKDHMEAVNGKIPEKYIPQLQHQLACSGLPYVYYLSFDGTEGVILGLTRDDKYIEKLVAAEKNFYEKHMLGFESPDVEKKQYREATDPRWMEYSKELRKVIKQKKELELQEEMLRASLIELCQGESTRGNGISLSKSMRKGAVDYGKIVELKGVDLEKYRKAPTESWKIDVEEKNSVDQKDLQA